jgi:Lon-like ATP-dependent protease
MLSSRQFLRTGSRSLLFKRLALDRAALTGIRRIQPYSSQKGNNNTSKSEPKTENKQSSKSKDQQPQFFAQNSTKLGENENASDRQKNNNKNENDKTSPPQGETENEPESRTPDSGESSTESQASSSSNGTGSNSSAPPSSPPPDDGDDKSNRPGRRRASKKAVEKDDDGGANGKPAPRNRRSSGGSNNGDNGGRPSSAGTGGNGPASSGNVSRPSSFGFRYASPDDKKQVLPLVINDRPAIPGYHRACKITDPEMVYAVRRIFYDNLEDQCIAVFLRKENSGGQGEMLQNVDEVHPVGSYCRIGGVFSRYEDGQDGCTITLLPLSRVRIGELIEPPSENITVTEEQGSNNLDVTSFENSVQDNESTDVYSLQVPWMKGLKVIEHEPYDVSNEEIQALCAEIIEVMRKLSQMSSIFREQIASFAMISLKPSNEQVGDPAALADFSAAMCEGSTEIQEVLETLNIYDRLEKALTLLNKELMQISLQDKFKKNVEVKLQSRYKKVYLEEKMNEIKKELGTDTKEKSTNVFRERMEKLTLPDHVKKAFEEEMSRLESTDPSSVEHSMTRNYVDWLTQMPWGIYSEDRYDIKRAENVLNDQHYGLKDVKDRILEFIATARLSGSVEGKIICFCGPPGVGKTSIGKSIAEALGRKFSRISVGGVNDVSEIKGHRRTYVGAVPGRVIQTLKQVQTQNPLILIDEIDKVGRVSTHGDPSAALLELLDPEQNSSFVDTFLDLPIDVSKVLFVCTANYMENIPPPLKDRMEIIDISGYVASERVAIAEQYLIPASKKATGLEDVNVKFDKGALEKLVSLYSRENGVRGLKKLIEKVHRKVALEVVKKYDTQTAEQNDAAVEEMEKREKDDKKEPEEAIRDIPPETPEKPVEGNITAEPATTSATSSSSYSTVSASSGSSATSSTSTTASTESTSSGEEKNSEWTKIVVPEDVEININVDNLKDYVGPPVHVGDRMYEETPAGVVMGLAYTEMGGVPLYVESVLQRPLSSKDTPELSRTGQLGEVMNESSTIAYSFCRMFMSKNFPENKFFDKAVIHLHCPEGAIKKDGPSAGITMTSSLLSLALDHPLDSTACMTGELTLTGKVLRIGGLKEKVMAAKLAGAKKVFFPYDNIADWENMPEFIREGLEPIPVKWYQEVFDRLFSSLDKETAKTLWKSQLSATE